ncbi:MAG: sulfide-dependent adenosine diphosphate thiazole synthase [Syntrophales bacterium]|nr:sulfide-dependent adenosine diphosphate thiazole synthase [Syntrophales bacterium]
MEPRKKEYLSRLKEAGSVLEDSCPGYLIPEVCSNLAFALPNAQSLEEVAAFPGRIVRIGDRIKVVSDPQFGASSHVANIVLTVMRHDSQYRSAMNIRFDEEILKRCQEKGLSIAEFDRTLEPDDVKAKEGATLEWGVDYAIRECGFVPDIIFDRGSVGKEPMIRVIGRDPQDVVDKIMRIAGIERRITDQMKEKRELKELEITRAIVERYMHKFLNHTEVDVAVVGGGPAGLVASYFLAKGGRKVAIFERKLSIGGGMWGGGMMFNEIVVQEEAKGLLDLFGVSTEPYGDGYYTADAIEAVTTICSCAMKSGVKIFNCITVEDVVIRDNRVIGLVITWSPVEMTGLHVDPLTIMAKCVIDATGHDTEVLRVIERKADITLETPTGKIMGERSMWSHKAELLTLENTKRICPGVYVAGMSANAAFGGPRMGPIFGGMLLSGKKVAELILKDEF